MNHTATYFLDSIASLHVGLALQVIGRHSSKLTKGGRATAQAIFWTCSEQEDGGRETA